MTEGPSEKTHTRRVVELQAGRTVEPYEAWREGADLRVGVRFTDGRRAIATLRDFTLVHPKGLSVTVTRRDVEWMLKLVRDMEDDV